MQTAKLKTQLAVRNFKYKKKFCGSLKKKQLEEKFLSKIDNGSPEMVGKNCNKHKRKTEVPEANLSILSTPE